MSAGHARNVFVSWGPEALPNHASYDIGGDCRFDATSGRVVNDFAFSASAQAELDALPEPQKSHTLARSCVSRACEAVPGHVIEYQYQSLTSGAHGTDYSLMPHTEPNLFYWKPTRWHPCLQTASRRRRDF